MRWHRVVIAFLFVTALLAGTWSWIARGPGDEAVQGQAMSGLNAGAIPGGDFALIDHNGRQVTRASFGRRHLLLSFGYTACPDICPLTLSTMAESLELLGPLAGQVQPLFVSLDPDRDNVAALADYVPHFDARILGLTGSLEAVADVARKYRVHFAKSGDGPDYSLDHSTAFYLIGPDGRVISYFPHDIGPPALASALAQAIGAAPGA